MKFFKVIIILSTLLIFTWGVIYIYQQLTDYYSLAEEKVVIYNKTTNHDTLTIIFIGDSWATYHSKYNNQLKNMVEDRLGIPVNVYSNGAIGAKTNAIYYYMSDTIPPFGTKDLLNKVPDYCIISAGINDAVAKLGTQNYCHHYTLVIKRLLSNGIKPIILDMPEVNYKLVYHNESLFSNIRHLLSSWITKAPLWNFEEYRIKLHSKLHDEGYENEIIYIPSKEWNSDGFRDSRGLYQDDSIHLNEKGYYLLDSCISSHIHKDWQ